MLVCLQVGGGTRGNMRGIDAAAGRAVSDRTELGKAAAQHRRQTDLQLKAQYRLSMLESCNVH